jgi:hypothetical protein
MAPWCKNDIKAHNLIGSCITRKKSATMNRSFRKIGGDLLFVRKPLEGLP